MKDYNYSWITELVKKLLSHRNGREIKHSHGNVKIQFRILRKVRLTCFKLLKNSFHDIFQNTVNRRDSSSKMRIQINSPSISDNSIQVFFISF